MVGNDTSDAADKSRCAHRSSARAARISSLPGQAPGALMSAIRQNEPNFYLKMKY
jgi:hypothetical protein